MTENDRTWSTGRTGATAVLIRTLSVLALGVLTLGGLWLALRALNQATRRVAGGSMRPALDDGDLVLTLPAWVREPRVGDVVIVRDPRRPERATVKRIAAVEDDWASLPDGPARVPRDRIAVRGDDPTASTDSRTYGTVPGDLVERHVIARLWPPRLLR